VRCKINPLSSRGCEYGTKSCVVEHLGEDWKKSNGRYDGVAMLASLTGLSKAEIEWTWSRMRYLRQVEGRTPEEAKRIVTQEGKAKPWEVTP